MRKWLCICDCQFPGQRRRRKGHIYEFDDSVTPPHHFEPVDGGKQLSMRSTKEEIIKVALDRGFDVNGEMTKREMLEMMGEGEQQ